MDLCHPTPLLLSIRTAGQASLLVLWHGAQQVQGCSLLHPSKQVLQGRVLDDIRELLAVGGGNQLHTPLGNRAGSQALCLSANLIDYNDLLQVANSKC